MVPRVVFKRLLALPAREAGASACKNRGIGRRFESQRDGVFGVGPYVKNE